MKFSDLRIYAYMKLQHGSNEHSYIRDVNKLCHICCERIEDLWLGLVHREGTSIPTNIPKWKNAQTSLNAMHGLDRMLKLY